MVAQSLAETDLYACSAHPSLPNLGSRGLSTLRSQTLVAEGNDGQNFGLNIPVSRALGIFGSQNLVAEASQHGVSNIVGVQILVAEAPILW